MRSVSPSMTPQQARHRPDDASRRERASTGVGMVITTMFLISSGITPGATSVSHQYQGLGMGYVPYSDVAGSCWNVPAIPSVLAEGDDDDNEVVYVNGGELANQESDVMEIDDAPAACSGDSVASSRQGSSMVIAEEDEAPTPQPLSSSVLLERVQLTQTAPETLAYVMQYLPLESLSRMREIAPAFSAVANWISEAPDWAEGRLVFTRWLETPKPKPVIPNALPTPFWWRCMNCADFSNNHQHCTSCGSPVNKAACRVFLGQLLKSCTADSVSHLIRCLLPGVTPLHIESHSNRSGNEKGCAWVYLNDPADCERLLDLNKRIFFDEDADGSMGFWMVGHDDRMTLSRFAENRNQFQNGRHTVLPRQPLVVEYPMGSLLRTSLETRSSAYVDENAGQWERGWFVPRAETY